MEIRNYTPGDEKHILELFQTVYGKPMSPEYWKWRFSDNPEKKFMIKLMWDEEKLVGHYAVSPVRLAVNGEDLLTALSMTTMTHPEYNGRGIFTSLAEGLYNEEAQKNGLKAVWGFPNNNSHYGFIKNLKWIDLEQIPTFSLDTARLKPVDQNFVSLITAFTEEHIVCANKLLANYKIRSTRSASYLAWRYLQNPIQKYAIFECKSESENYYAVTKLFPSFSEKGKFEIDLLELSFPADQGLLLSLSSAIIKHYESYKPIKINTWMPLSSAIHLQLEKIGFTNGSPVTYSGIRILDAAYQGMEDPSNWYYSMGDSDIY